MSDKPYKWLKQASSLGVMLTSNGKAHTVFGKLRRANRREETVAKAPAIPQPERALELQKRAETLHELAQRQEQVTLLLQSALIQQRSILSSWGELGENEDDDLTSEALAFEAAFQDLIGHAVQLTRQALLRQQREVNLARSSLETGATNREPELTAR